MSKVDTGSEANANTDLFKTAISSNTKTWTLATYKVILAVIHVTVVMIIVALADFVVIAVVSLVFGNPSSQPLLAQYIFSLLKVLSILGTALLYIIYLAYSLIGETRRVVKLLKEEKS